MTPSARVQAAIEVLDTIIAAARDNGAPADRIIVNYFRERRFAGSKDRRTIRDLVYRAIRSCGERPESGRAAMVAMADMDPELAVQFDGRGYGAAAIDTEEPRAIISTVPKWMETHFCTLIDQTEQAALLDRAMLDIRINPDKAGPGDIKVIWPDAASLPLTNAMRLPSGTAVEGNPLYDRGALEIQDLGSQAIVESCPAIHPRLILDLCAGAGGKTLALAAKYGTECRIIAADTDRTRLSALRPRAERAGYDNIETLLLNPGQELEMLEAFAGQCDLVLVDAPCSGSGTWRRAPELRWRLTPERLAAVAATQARLLSIAARLTVSDGWLVYATCSVFDAEGHQQIAEFLRLHPGWHQCPVSLPIGREYRKDFVMTPYHDGTDGFFLSHLAVS
jgi:16S rRNA (cytosine967-C5)-methyltransferase